jgi:hypothetical protein
LKNLHAWEYVASYGATMKRIQVGRAALIAALCMSAAWAQEFRSSISGRVLDQQGAAVAGQPVTGIQVETGARTTTVSAANGDYTLPFLPPGTYRLTCEAPGFKKYAREGIVLGTNERRSVDIELQLGAVTETLTVTSEVAMLETATASLGQVISSRQIENMPLNGRTPLLLSKLAYGVLATGRPLFTRPFDVGGQASLSVGGAPAQTNELLLDGSPNAARDDRGAYSPPMDAVQELKVESFQSDAAYGHTGGGTFNLVTKSGSNQFHGSLYEFNQVSKLAATAFFINKGGQKKGVARFNQWGGTVGGPMVIPKLYNGRNKLFFFFAYEGVNHPAPDPGVGTLPTKAQRSGDLSQLLTVGANYQVYDPLTGVREGSRVRRQPFANNRIPATRIHPVASALLKYYPLPNYTGRADGRDNYLSSIAKTWNYDNELSRADYNISERHKLFGSFRHSYALAETGNFLGNIATGKNVLRINYQASVDDVYTLSPTSFLNTRLSFARFKDGQTRPGDGFDMTQLGLPASLRAAAQKESFPRFEMTSYTALGEDAGNVNHFDTFQVFSSLSRFHGRHSLKVGTDLRLYRNGGITYSYSSGTYAFGTDWTRGPLDSAAASPIGQDLAAFLLGLPTGGGFDVNAYSSTQSNYAAFFLQDDFRARSNLTLNLGLRYEREAPTTERFNRQVVGFDATATNSATRAAVAALAQNPVAGVAVSAFHPTGGLLFASPDQRNPYETGNRYFSPRFGFSWTPAALGSKTVLRGGVGVFFFDLGLVTPNQFGFSQRTSLTPTLDAYLTPRVTLSNPYPEGILQPPGSSLGVNTYLGQSVSFFQEAQRTPYSVRWNFNVQRQLAANLVLETGYVGNHSVHMPVDRALGFVPAEYLSRAPLRDQATVDFLTASVPNPMAGLLPGTSLNGSVVQRQALLRSFPTFSGVTTQSTPVGSSYFHMLVARLEKRYSQGLQLLGNYRYSRLMEQRSFLNASDLFPEKRVADEDRPHNLTVSATYDLPFGAGKGKSSGGARVVRAVAGGWNVSAIYTYQSGSPLAWGQVVYDGGPLQYDAKNIERAFDVTRFNRATANQPTSNIRTFPTRFANLRIDAMNNVDLSVSRKFQIRENLRLSYRCEFFNSMNHPQFAAPNLSPTSSSFGAITSQNNEPRIVQMSLRLAW